MKFERRYFAIFLRRFLFFWVVHARKRGRQSEERKKQAESFCETSSSFFPLSARVQRQKRGAFRLGTFLLFVLWGIRHSCRCPQLRNQTAKSIMKFFSLFVYFFSLFFRFGEEEKVFPWTWEKQRAYSLVKTFFFLLLLLLTKKTSCPTQTSIQFDENFFLLFFYFFHFNLVALSLWRNYFLLFSSQISFFTFPFGLKDELNWSFSSSYRFFMLFSHLKYDICTGLSSLTVAFLRLTSFFFFSLPLAALSLKTLFASSVTQGNYFSLRSDS